MKIYTFFTKGYYEEVAEKYILKSAKEFNVDIKYVCLEGFHDWKKNTALKASIIKNIILKEEEDIVLLDADATFGKYPDLLFNIPKEYDMAVHYLDWNKFWRNEPTNKKELCSGTIMFRYNIKVLELLDKWIKENELNPHQWEQKNLENILKKSDNIKIFHLPEEYLAIIKRDGTISSSIKEPVILHHQISRESKRKNI